MLRLWFCQTLGVGVLLGKMRWDYAVARGFWGQPLQAVGDRILTICGMIIAFTGFGSRIGAAAL